MAIVTDLTYRKASEATRARLLERLICGGGRRASPDRAGAARRDRPVAHRPPGGASCHRGHGGLRRKCGQRALRLRDVAAQTVDDVGRLARGLHPAVLDDLGLAAAARRYVGDYVRSFGTAVDFVAGDLDSPRLAPLVAATMYRILQETLTNVARHARARTSRVELKRDESAHRAAGAGRWRRFRGESERVESRAGPARDARARHSPGRFDPDRVEARTGYRRARAHSRGSACRARPGSATSPSASAARPSARSRRP